MNTRAALKKRGRRRFLTAIPAAVAVGLAAPAIAQPARPARVTKAGSY